MLNFDVKDKALKELERAVEEIEQSANKTQKLADACLATFNYLQKKAPKDYKSFSPAQK